MTSTSTEYTIQELKNLSADKSVSPPVVREGIMGKGTGGTGRIHIDYSTSYTGTTTPTINATLDTTIKAGGANFFAFF